jgi:hypothetical protein
MPLSEETVCANPARIESRLQLPPSWVPDLFEIPDAISATLRMRFRAIAWGVLISALLWGSFFMAGRALWEWWR